jgi:abhydrolase domain-containing protein 1/3
LDCETEKEANHPTVLFLPGLTGDSRSDYIKSFINVARYSRLGARCVVLNYRGLGGVPLKTPRTNCKANTEDVSDVIEHIKMLHPDSPLMALGVSLGGILRGNYLVAKGEDARSKLVAVLLVSAIWDVFHGLENMEKWGLNLILNRYITNRLIKIVKDEKHHFEHLRNYDSVLSSQTMIQFDQSFTAPQFGYKDVDHYYKEASLVGKLKHIKVPVLAINAHDDPFQPGESLPTEETNSNDYVAILTTQYGGHIGFIEGWLPTHYHYSDRVFSQFSNAIFSNVENLSSV